MTEVLTTRAELRDALATIDRSIGFVPTMGGLHDGHRALMARSRAENATSVVSIFLNPRQFGDTSDLLDYPRDRDADLATCEAEGVDIVWAPTVDDVYATGFDTTVSVGALAEPLEGAARPGHFESVATVVAILLTAVSAERAYFGRKDAQQLLVISRMAHDLGIATEIVPCPTVREADGLALSTRNEQLSPAERAAAPVLYRALATAEDMWARGERSGEVMRGLMGEILASQPLAQVEYVSCADTATLRELQLIEGSALLSLAVVFGTTRLIDNITVTTED
jgi:pantoate--beta-alanine ligase